VSHAYRGVGTFLFILISFVALLVIPSLQIPSRASFLSLSSPSVYVIVCRDVSSSSLVPDPVTTMVFYPPKWVPQMPFDPPDSCTVADFMFGEQYKRVPYGKSLPAFTCGLTGKQIEASEMPTRVDHLASGLAQEFGWAPNQGSEWDKVVNIFSLNTVSG
jgi:hypothetical protein